MNFINLCAIQALEASRVKTLERSLWHTRDQQLAFPGIVVKMGLSDDL